MLRRMTAYPAVAHRSVHQGSGGATGGLSTMYRLLHGYLMQVPRSHKGVVLPDGRERQVCTYSTTPGTRYWRRQRRFDRMRAVASQRCKSS